MGKFFKKSTTGSSKGGEVKDTKDFFAHSAGHPVLVHHAYEKSTNVIKPGAIEKKSALQHHQAQNTTPVPFLNKTKPMSKIVVYGTAVGVLLLFVPAFLASSGPKLVSEFVSGLISTATTTLEQILSWDFGNAIAAFVAVGGYVLEQLLSRKSSQTEKQMERVAAQSHQLLVPLTMQIQSLMLGSILSFIDKHVNDLLVSREELEKYEKMNIEMANNSPHVEIPTMLTNPLSYALMIEVMFVQREAGRNWRVCVKNELPLPLHKEIKACDRESRLWKSYEAFVRHSLVPAIEKIAEIIDEQGDLMEPVSPTRLREMFGTEGTG